MNHPDVTCIACGIFEPELSKLEQLGKIGFPIIYLDSMLHMKPRKLGKELTSAVEQELARGKSVVLLYGKCQPHMFALEKQDGVFRVQGSNCIEILLGPERYRKIRRDRSFVLMREWVQRWEEVFTHGLGFSAENIKMFMPEYHSELIYIDSDTGAMPSQLMNECAAFCALPWRYETISLDPLYQSICSVLKRIKG
jgi:hypothetical protein